MISDLQNCPKPSSRYSRKIPLAPKFMDVAWFLSQEGLCFSPQGNHRGALHIYEELEVSSLGRVLPGGWLSTWPRTLGLPICISSDSKQTSRAEQSPDLQEGFGQAWSWGTGALLEDGGGGGSRQTGETWTKKWPRERESLEFERTDLTTPGIVPVSTPVFPS